MSVSKIGDEQFRKFEKKQYLRKVLIVLEEICGRKPSITYKSIRTARSIENVSLEKFVSKVMILTSETKRQSKQFEDAEFEEALRVGVD